MDLIQELNLLVLKNLLHLQLLLYFLLGEFSICVFFKNCSVLFLLFMTVGNNNEVSAMFFFNFGQLLFNDFGGVIFAI